MLQTFFKIQLLSFLLIACSSQNSNQNHFAELPQAPVSSSSDAQLTEEQYLRLTRGVFEIVIPRLEDKDIVYQEKLPEHLLPFKLRKSPYRGIGTAFAIAPNRFVSAAHVFDLHEASQVVPAALRDTEGKVYAIDKVLRYSQHRDLIEFSLKAPPKNVEALKLSMKPRMGQYVFTAGNALGDGIVTRSGYITSFTPEAVDGEWDDIRYSAPASPGNSGGPLLSKDLEVLGIVVRRTQNENLNFAMPISELNKVKGAQFFMRDVKLEQFKKQISRDWKFNLDLPADMQTITRAAANSYFKFQEKIYNDFQKEFKDDVFPTDPKLKTWAKDSMAINLAGFIQKDNNDKWGTVAFNWNVVKLEKYRSIITEKGADRANTAFFMLERPRKKKLKEFYQDGQGILETFIKQINWSRNYAGRRIEIKSFSKPERTERWADSYGRKWISWEWNTVYDDRTLQLDCLPIPAGMFCVFNSDPFHLRELNRMSTRRVMDRFAIDVYGKLRDWKEYADLPAEWKQPIIPQNIELEFSKDKKVGLKWKVAQYSGSIPLSEYDLDAEMALSFISSPKNIFKLNVRNVQLAEKDGDMQMGVGTNYRPDEDGNTSYREVWDKMMDKRAPYNGRPQMQGKHSLIVSLNENLNPNFAKAQSVNFVTCGVLNSFGEARIKEICEEYSKTVNVSSTR